MLLFTAKSATQGRVWLTVHHRGKKASTLSIFKQALILMEYQNIHIFPRGKGKALLHKQTMWDRPAILILYEKPGVASLY